jgi:hypothetical protein
MKNLLSILLLFTSLTAYFNDELKAAIKTELGI